MTAAAPIEDSTARHLSHLLAAEQRTSRLPSVAAGIVRDGSLAWSDAVGTLDGRATGDTADADTQYRMGSITKTFVAVAVLQLRDRGRLDLLDRFGEHVPGTAFGDVTIAQLLSHGAGLQAETEGPWWERTAGLGWDDLAASPVRQRFRAGRRFHYTNVGFAALGELVARAHGADWFEVIRRDLLEPLGMTRTTTRPTGKSAQGLAVHPFADVLLPEPEHDAGAMAPAGQLWSTVEDLGRWAAFAGGDTGDVLAADTLEEMLEPHTLADNPGQPWTAAHGLGWQVWNLAGRKYAGHGGSMPGFLAGLRVDVETGDGVVVLANTTAGMRPVGSDLLAAFVEREPRVPQVWHASGDASVLDVVGMWHWGPSVTVARAVGEHLVLGEPGQARGSRFAPVGDDEWVGLDGYYTGEPLRLVRRSDGTPSHLDLASFRFTRTPYDADADVPGGVDDAGWR
ncbi:CubicO group peptidase (beta-lactamase class C family) [Humibacillus xanthopallidus]|uniref:CubicO group peptidase (Beta-lactamase class C family) n=1 Tax=Humibacillus xanthopallidus TaxID=412689 RepID=A0A543PMN0_9MICO|nr:serine hydrolase domain-containing protein [Humibacillus xanthopallidus]TQN45313.1 CubicO group peptidase (beta-lactamase class C family) [Humibacillus xanthopallidus]